MRMKIETLTVLIILVFPLYSQEQKSTSSFVSIHIGIMNTDREDFSDKYESNTGFVFGGGIGLQASHYIALVAKLTYFHKTGVPLIRTYSYDLINGTRTLVSEKKEGTASYTQWLINAGLQVYIIEWNQFVFNTNGGVLSSVTSEDVNTPSYTSSASGKGIYGYFIGLNIEKEIEATSFAPFFELQYNKTRSDIQPTGGHFGGVNISLGCKYSFNK